MSITLDEFDTGWDSFRKLQSIYLSIKENMDELAIQYKQKSIDELDIIMQKNDHWENLVLQLFSLREDLRNKRKISIHQIDYLGTLAYQAFQECWYNKNI